MEKVMDEGHVVLVDKKNNVLGTAPKHKTHNQKTPLHRGFSLFLFNKKGELLLQQRSKTKKTFPLVWSNSCCGHPMLNESNADAAKRRLSYELGIDDIKVFEVIADYKYEVSMNHIYENEICPILVCFTSKKPTMNKDEVENIRWISWQKFLKEIEDKNETYSLWSKEEAKLLSENEEFLQLYQEYVK